MRYQFRRTIAFRIWLLLAIILILRTTTTAQYDQQRPPPQQQHHHSCTPPSNSNYDWERLNFYEILGFKTDDRSKISSSEVRQAYRSMAQKFHPDKTRGKNITKEESNARFTRIANAYEILADSDKRKEYDQFLQDCEHRNRNPQQQKTQQHYGNHPQPQQTFEEHDWSYFFDHMASTDPRRVFEEFFFGTSSPWDNNNNYNEFRQPRTSFPRTSYRNDPTAPRRVQEHQEVLYDPYSGEEILRVRQTEEYNVDSNGKYYYRVVAQDFAERLDSFHGWGFHPISQPFVLEEGYRQQSQQQQQQRQQQQYEGDAKSRKGSSTLRTGEYLFPQSALLTSENGRYYAGVSPECELLIMSDSSQFGDNVDDVVIWTSETFVPPSQNRGCFLTVSGPHLILVLGSPDRPGNVLWHSQSAVDNDDDRKGRVAPTYFARLDDDGRLAVYRQRILLKKKDSTRDPTTPKDHWTTWLFHGPKILPQTKAARAWDSVRRWLLRSVQRNGERTTSPHITTEESCVYATGVAGCNRPVRKLVHLATDVTYSLKRTLSKIDGAMDGFVEFLGNGGGDDDMVDTFLRILNKAGRDIRDAGHRIAYESAQAVRDTLNKRFAAAKLK